MILNIIKHTDENSHILLKKSENVKSNTPELQKLIEDMFDTLSSTDGVGLAAPQVGHNINLFIIKIHDFEKVYINPKIVLKGFDIITKEGCLSVPEIECEVKRKDRVQIEYRDRNWKKFKDDYSDVRAIICQHEYDHLLGKLII